MHEIRPWIIAARPKTLTASIVPVLVGASLAYALTATINVALAIVTALCAISIQIATNLFNDVIDFRKGADTASRLGPTRVTQSGILSSDQVHRAAWICLGVALFLGVVLVVHGGWPILVIGIFSLLLGYCYTGGPYPLAYHGLGEIFVLIFFGVIAVAGSTYLQTLSWHLESFVAGVQVGLLAVTIIAINNLRDIHGDELAEKKTLAVRLGEVSMKLLIVASLILPFVLGVFWVGKGMSGVALLPLLVLPPVIGLIKNFLPQPPSSLYNQFLSKAALVHLLFGVIFSVGLLFQFSL